MDFRIQQLSKAAAMLDSDPVGALRAAFVAGKVDELEFAERMHDIETRDRAAAQLEADNDRALALEERKFERDEKGKNAEWEREQKLAEVEAKREQEKLRWDAKREKSRLAREAAILSAENERTEKLRALLYEREDMLRGESNERTDRQHRLDVNLEVVREFAKRGHLDLANINLDRVIDELVPAAQIDVGPTNKPVPAVSASSSADSEPSDDDVSSNGLDSFSEEDSGNGST